MDKLLDIREKQKKINSLSETRKYISGNNLEVMSPNIKKVMNILLITSVTSPSVKQPIRPLFY